MRGKYSPTVSAAYMKDQEWWKNYSTGNRPNVFEQYDPEGYDSYGYDVNDTDRAGNQEHEYYHNDNEYGDNYAYEHASCEWGFDGTKPVKKR